MLSLPREVGWLIYFFITYLYSGVNENTIRNMLIGWYYSRFPLNKKGLYFLIDDIVLIQ